MKINRRQVKHLLQLARTGLTSLQALKSGAGDREMCELVNHLERESIRKPKVEKTAACECPPRIARSDGGTFGIEYASDGTQYDTWQGLAGVEGYPLLRDHLVSKQPLLSVELQTARAALQASRHACMDLQNMLQGKEAELIAAHSTIKAQARVIEEQNVTINAKNAEIAKS